jgi:protease I
VACAVLLGVLTVGALGVAGWALARPGSGQTNESGTDNGGAESQGPRGSGAGPTRTNDVVPRVGKKSAVDTPGRKVLMVLPYRRFWFRDYDEPYRVLTSGGVRVVVASSEAGEASPAPDSGANAAPVKVELTLADARAEDYDAVIFVGSAGAPEFVWNAEQARQAGRLIRDMNERRRLVTAVCVGTTVLAEAGALKGKRATGPVHQKATEMLRKGGATVVDEEVVEDGNVITGRDPAAARRFGEVVLARLKK